ncbi:putative F-box protein At1g67623 [Coffea arabica]|uniref:F-box protein At1g67623 n=1 Tax=Coffea arabica TaxID=13443 RepID=A0A6P6TZA0_COFAR|nr:putative F-box protein At1g67623 [Coffea arabica]
MANEQNLPTIASISSLPREVLADVLARVAASSSTDLFWAKLCCKLFSEVLEGNNVYQRVSLDKFEIVPWHKNHRVSKFLKKCRQSKNPEALYRKGVVGIMVFGNLLHFILLFTFKLEMNNLVYDIIILALHFDNLGFFGKGKNVEAALECHDEAAQSGHDEAAYALGIIFLFGGDHLNPKGMTLISGMKKSETQKRKVKHCRDSLRRILRRIWVQNPVVLSQRPICYGMQHNSRRCSWPMHEIDEEDITCEGCACDDEIATICDALPPFIV